MKGYSDYIIVMYRKTETYICFWGHCFSWCLKCQNVSHTSTGTGGYGEKCDCNCSSNLHRQPWMTLAKTLQAVNKNKQCACHFSTKTFLTPLRIGLNLKWKEKVRIQIENRLSKCANKNAKTALKMYLFWWGCIFATLQASLYLPFIACWQSAKHKRMAEKGDFLSEFWLSLHAKDDQRKFDKFDKQLTFKPPKGLETSQQSTRNLALCVISMGWEKKKENKHFCHFKPWQQVLTCYHHGDFFASHSAWLLWTALFAVLMAQLFVEWSTR